MGDVQTEIRTQDVANTLYECGPLNSEFSVCIYCGNYIGEKYSTRDTIKIDRFCVGIWTEVWLSKKQVFLGG